MTHHIDWFDWAMFATNAWPRAPLSLTRPPASRPAASARSCGRPKRMAQWDKMKLKSLGLLKLPNLRLIQPPINSESLTSDWRKLRTGYVSQCANFGLFFGFIGRYPRPILFWKISFSTNFGPIFNANFRPKFECLNFAILKLLAVELNASWVVGEKNKLYWPTHPFRGQYNKCEYYTPPMV
jgi:hypothetical protein